ncbi:Serine hydroxymethyltransferase [Pyrenophora tritici-repentis]|nr:Serine hydroxymethyltransferase [Pyrenophora tritici-repentis]KAG9380418.1 Serine hydroxymethyltransferase [Pyrenophora tritici-repentis]KAI2478562.1 Serine hydroxymethyltransferase [Pyrenophora tritici-repentis]
MSSYALPKSHQDLMEKSLVDTDNEVAQIMVRYAVFSVRTVI